jgi:hypothetical protein
MTAFSAHVTTRVVRHAALTSKQVHGSQWTVFRTQQISNLFRRRATSPFPTDSQAENLVKLKNLLKLKNLSTLQNLLKLENFLKLQSLLKLHGHLLQMYEVF